MQTVLIVGAGKSSAWVIDYMLKNAQQRWRVILMDTNRELLYERLNHHSKGTAAPVDIHDQESRQSLVKKADIVISLMPADLHIILAEDCLKFGKHLITSSYMTDKMQSMGKAAKAAGLMFMCEMGLDPGIDHMSAAHIIQGIHRIAGFVTSYKSYCGALITPESDDNPWHYKVTWNAKNIILAGQSGAKWKEHHVIKKSPYEAVFERPQEIDIPGFDSLAAYPNRDSLKYQKLYGIEEAETILRATIRHQDFIKGWNYIVHAGLTDPNDQIDAENMTFAGWVAAKTNLPEDEHLVNNFKNKFKIDTKTMTRLEWLRIFEPRLINGQKGDSSETILQQLLERRWKMSLIDKDMVIMQHQFEYERRGTKGKVVATMIVEGENKTYSAIAKTVGLPIGILAKRILTGKTNPENLAGVHIPIMPEVFTPVLKELKKHGISFVEDLF